MSTLTEHARKTRLLPPEPASFAANHTSTLRIYPVSNYTFGVKDPQPEEDPSVVLRMKRLRDQYKAHGMRRSCRAIFVCHEHGHPYILMLQVATTFYKLPGGYLQPNEDEIEGFKRVLTHQLSPQEGNDWQIGECVSQWWRPNFESFMYPFIPPHVTRPKECEKLYLINLPRQCKMEIPSNMKMLAIPLYELFDNSQSYGNMLASIPAYLSRFNFEYVDNDDNVVSKTPASS